MFCLLFGLLWVSVVGFSTIHAGSAAYNAYKDGEYQTVEGIVSDFHPMPYEGHQDECFSVADQRFCYSDYEIAPGFHNATSHGGPIRAGLPVRISYRDGRILKLEVPRGDVLTPAQSAAIGTGEVAASLTPFLAEHDAILMANHGAVRYGSTLLEAFQRMETVEHLAQIALAAHQLGEPNFLRQEQIEQLRGARSRYLRNAR